jgi:hypothetical protein
MSDFAVEGASRVARNESFDSIASVDFLVDSMTLESESKTEMTQSAMRLREIAGEIKEPLLMEDKSRFVLFPIKHHDVSLFIMMFLSFNLFC